MKSLSHILWRATAWPGKRAFCQELGDSKRAQEALLEKYLAENRHTAFGEEHSFANIRSYAQYTERVPVRTYDEFQPWLSCIFAGEAGILTTSRVERLVPTSGSTSAVKWIPHTVGLMREFRRALAPWISDLYECFPGLQGGSAYWSVSPAMAPTAPPGCKIPVGFEDDGDYLGGFLKAIVGSHLAVPGKVKDLTDLRAFQYLTLLFLLRARDLRMISVWHPSFLTLLLEALPSYWDSLLGDIEAGGATSPTGMHDEFNRLFRELEPDPMRAKELRRLDPTNPRMIWPELAVISCWTSGPARTHVAALENCFPDTPIQGKGLMATEGFISLPFMGETPLAVRSHFFEFLDGAGRAHMAHEVENGAEYRVILSTAGGLYRYDLGDRVEVTGFLRGTPCLRFLGKSDMVSDRTGEKLSEGFVRETLEHVFALHDLAPAFFVLAPEPQGGQEGYTLFLECDQDPQPWFLQDLEEGLRRNPCYRYAADLGQLAPAQVFAISEEGNRTYLRRLYEMGSRLGDIKPTALSPLTEWSKAFEGHFLTTQISKEVLA